MKKLRLASVLFPASLSIGTLCWWYGRASLVLYNGQQAAVCIDGRPLGRPVLEAKVGVDDTQRDDSIVTMKCAFPTAAYQCDDAIGEGWMGRCAATVSALATEPLFPQGSWPLRSQVTTVSCSLFGASRCSKRAWDCANSSKCDAYEKTARVCATHYLRRGPYACFVVAGDTGQGIHENVVGFPFGWLLVGIVAMTLLCFALYSFVTALAEDDLSSLLPSWEDLKLQAAALVVFALLLMVTTFVVSCFMGVDEVKGVQLTDYKNLLTMGSANATQVLMPESEPPGPLSPAIMLGLLFSPFAGVLGLLFAFKWMKARRKPPKRRRRPSAEVDDDTISIIESSSSSE